MFKRNSRILRMRLHAVGLGATALALTLCLVASPSPTAAKPDLSDGAITNAVENDFLFDSAVPFNAIDVETANGIVTLTGTVDNILAKDRARELAQTVRGVRAVVDRMIVRPSSRSARQIRSDVEKALLLDPATDSYEVNTEVGSNGVVTLKGSVNSWPEKQLCETVTKRVAGVTDVQNQIKVIFDGHRLAGEIKPEIEKRLHWDVLVDADRIDVKVERGEVSLSGTVGSAAEKRRARQDAWVAGVVSVDDSNLEVAEWMRDDMHVKKAYIAKEDDEVREAVKDAFIYDPRVQSFEITPTVSAGVVTLRGIVDNVRAKHAAAQDAYNTVGVIDVQNRIKVRTNVLMNDGAIADNIRHAILLDPWVEHYEITVNVFGGMAHLYGTVDTSFDRMRAEAIANRIRGVVAVRNHLKVEFEDSFTHSPYIYPYWWYSHPLHTSIRAEPRKTDAAIASDIRDELWWDPFVDEDDISVSVNNGIATLTGTVDDRAEYGAARNNALEGGAVRVINRLQYKDGDES